MYIGALASKPWPKASRMGFHDGLLEGGDATESDLLDPLSSLVHRPYVGHPMVSYHEELQSRTCLLGSVIGAAC